ncbi:hypothetical protein CHGG_10147 [Chaetomium globosum CBS 148.51]|uniref:NmrA-like domain-containing protein n=1 Tax=Chaetomium globosum (strain ATCC 6205 / CBS 148.51 / DSM 1962 / NBRC 6347 / NRRL 1970) TaxID=306901 RepID=Q2GPF7_CHAGB|nr:uncharacterized protein CHGG_10147 [Chaetomium globosum CBS 148.51]EAQ83743.1 hypothetical protein CHGG_10147 [Chaetomium globosum CBS 148.51]
MAPQNIVVVGATGQQGGAVVKSLLDLPESSSRFRILALTRNAQSERARHLVSEHNGTVSLIEGDNADPGPIFASQPEGSIDSIFIVTVPGQKTPEEQQAIPLIDAAVAHGVKHIVFSSVDRGGDEKSWTNPTTIKHFLAKHNIELYLRDKADKEAGGKFTWTILRPVCFMDNMKPGHAVLHVHGHVGRRAEARHQAPAGRRQGYRRVWYQGLERPREVVGQGRQPGRR